MTADKSIRVYTLAALGIALLAVSWGLYDCFVKDRWMPFYAFALFALAILYVGYKGLYHHFVTAPLCEKQWEEFQRSQRRHLEEKTDE